MSYANCQVERGLAASGRGARILSAPGLMPPRIFLRIFLSTVAALMAGAFRRLG